MDGSPMLEQFYTQYKIMNKEDRLKLIKRIFTEPEEIDFGGFEPTALDVKETLEYMDSFRENEKDEKTQHDCLTSDEI